MDCDASGERARARGDLPRRPPLRREHASRVDRGGCARRCACLRPGAGSDRDRARANPRRDRRLARRRQAGLHDDAAIACQRAARSRDGASIAHGMLVTLRSAPARSRDQRRRASREDARGGRGARARLRGRPNREAIPRSRLAAAGEDRVGGARIHRTCGRPRTLSIRAAKRAGAGLPRESFALRRDRDGRRSRERRVPAAQRPHASAPRPPRGGRRPDRRRRALRRVPGRSHAAARGRAARHGGRRRDRAERADPAGSRLPCGRARGRRGTRPDPLDRFREPRRAHYTR